MTRALRPSGRSATREPPIRICVAANEDGFGPSAFAYYLIGALGETWRAQRRARSLEVLLLNKRAFHLNRALYVSKDNVWLIRLDSVIRLERHAGEVCVSRTVRAVKAYVAERDGYCRKASRVLQGCALSVDIGVPLLARAARQLGVPHVTFFDHSWARTLRGLVSREAEYSYNPAPTGRNRTFLKKLASEIEQDEKCTREVFLFDRYLTPIEFRQHWRKLGFRPRILPGVLGTRQDARASRALLNRILRQLGQPPVSGEKLVLVTPGGTPVWDAFTQRMITGYLARQRGSCLPVFAPYRPASALKRRMRASGNVRWFGLVPGGTLQSILPAFALVVTKASGGIVNDCLASGTPLVCIEERQWQVKLIERECKRLKLIPDLPQSALDEFRRDPVGCIDSFFAKRAKRPPPALRAGAERELAAALIERLDAR